MNELPPTLLHNLSALKEMDYQLAERICLPVSSDHIQVTDSAAFYVSGSNVQQLSVPLADVKQSTSSIADRSLVFLFGLGVGDQLDYILMKYPNTRIVAWERDPWLLRMTLCCGAYGEYIRSGHLQFVLGADIFDRLSSLPADIVWHPVLKSIYKNEVHLIESDGTRPRVLTCGGSSLQEEIADELRRRGNDVYTWDISRQSREELIHVAQVAGARQVVAINYTRELVEICRDLGLQLSLWQTDPSPDRLSPCAGSKGAARIFTYRQSLAEDWRRKGYGEAKVLPLAIDPDRRKPVALGYGEEKYSSRVAFIGHSMVENATLQRHRFLELANKWSASHRDFSEELEQVLAGQRTDFGAYRIPQYLDLYFPGLNMASQVYENWPDPAMVVGEIAAMEWRRAVVDALAPMGLVVWGDEGWQGCKAEWRGPAADNEINKIASNGQIHIDISPIHQRDMVSLRIFEVLACGGFVLAEHNPAIAEQFVIGEDLDTWRTIDELKTKVQHYLAHPDEAQRMAKSGQAKVLANHTVRHRVDVLLGA